MKVRIVRHGFDDYMAEFSSDEYGFEWSSFVRNWDEKHFTQLDSAENISFYNVPDED